MAEVIPNVQFVVKYGEREYKTVMKALAIMAGVAKPGAARADERKAAAELNLQMLESQRSYLRQQAEAVDSKLERRSPTRRPNLHSWPRR
jgi:hypothetical protein